MADVEEIKEALPLEPQGEPSTPESEEKEQTVPIHRFQEVYGKMKSLEQDITALKNQGEKSGLSEEQRKELQAKEYLKGLLKETLAEDKKSKETAEQAEAQQFKEQVGEVLDINTDVKKSDFLKFLETEADSYGIEDVKGAMNLYRKLNNLSKEVAEKTKKELSQKPSLPSHEGGSAMKEYPEDKGKSLWQIAKEAVRGK